MDTSNTSCTVEHGAVITGTDKSIKKRGYFTRGARRTLGNERGAVDLLTVLAGAVVAAILAGAAVAAFGPTLPWSQDRTATNSLSAVATAQETNYGMNQKYLPIDQLVSAKLLSATENVEVTVTGANYCAVATSETGKKYYAVNGDSKITETAPAGATCPA